MKPTFLFYLIAATFLLNAQGFGQITVSGKIQNEKEIPLEGVSIKDENTKNGTSTNKDGLFTLVAGIQQPLILTISSVGYITQKITVPLQPGGSNYVSIILKEEIRKLEEVIVEEKINRIQVEHLPDVQNTYLSAGKKTEVIQLSGVNGNLSEKTGRQIFAKIPGVFVYDMDGGGNQINISTRGLDPHRSWEYNIRQNGIITNSDMYGYPASHYSPAMESIERIELVRGTGSLQYGAQFGGMINYITKQPDTTRAFSFESINTGGSFGLFSTYNALGGKVGKLTYSAYYHRRHSNGYRKNARSDAKSEFTSLTYDFTKNLSLKAEIGRSTYVYQIPGPLTDAMFANDPRQSTRARNYFNPDILVPSVTLDWKINRSFKLKWSNSGVYGARNSVIYDAFANVKDSINPATNQFKARTVDIDNFKSFTSEIRLIHQYKIAEMNNFLSAGIQVMRNKLHRRQLGKGTTGSDFDLSVTDPVFGRDMYLTTRNVALFIENLLYLSPRLSVSPGLRIENGKTDMTGTIAYYQPENIPNTIRHRFPLFGISSQFLLSEKSKVYASFSQAYRPVVFKDIIPASVLEQIDKNPKNAWGYNIETGITGHANHTLTYDISLFRMLYKNRMGMLSLTGNDGVAYLLRTNTGNSITQGIEIYAEYKPYQVITAMGVASSLSIFTSTSYFDARYQKGSVVIENKNTSIAGNKLEGVPNWISRNGIQVQHNKIFMTLQYSYVSANFSDPANTEIPSANGTKGKVPSYGLWDINGTLHLGQHYTMKFGVNNLANKQYYTKRPTMYPGAGIWSSDGRSFVVSFGIKI